MTAANLVEPSAAKRYAAVPVAFIDEPHACSSP